MLNLIKRALANMLTDAVVFWSNVDQCYKVYGKDKQTNKAVLLHSAIQFDGNRELVSLQLKDNTIMQFRKLTIN